MQDLNSKKQILDQYLKNAGKVLVAFSGGADSAFLLKAAHDILGSNAIAITAVSKAYPERELKDAKDFCKKYGIKHILFETDELSIDGFSSNPVNRCYICKKAMFKKVIQIAEENSIIHILEGSNTDDDNDYRPGAAALKELGIGSPLKEAGFSKAEIRQLSKEAGLPTWNKPSAACMYSRFAYGELITEEKLAMIEKAEQLLLELGFSQVRVRVHQNLARIETSEKDLEKLMEPDIRKTVTDYLKNLGFAFVTADLSGYRTGSMNQTSVTDLNI